MKARHANMAKIGCLAWLWVLAWGCRSPVGLERQRFQPAQGMWHPGFPTGPAGDEARAMLSRHGWLESFHQDPDGTLRQWHAWVAGQGRNEELPALALMSFSHAGTLSRSPRPGDARRAPGWYLASAAYAWFHVMGELGTGRVELADPRLDSSRAIYNAAVGLAFRRPRDGEVVVVPSAGQWEAGAGWIRVAGDPGASGWDADAVEKYLPSADYQVRGLGARDRVMGLGAPLIGVGRPGARAGQLELGIPATLFLRFEGNLGDWAAEGLRARLELYPSHEVPEVAVQGRPVPLEADFTAPLAHGLRDSAVWSLGLVQLLTGEERVRGGIHLTEPYQRGKIPVVFVHGTASSPAYWAEMWNTLRADPVLRGRFQFWNFVYNSANPVGHSAANFRAELEGKLRELDPGGGDVALRRMVVVGHSQGGLIAGLTAKDTGDALWRAVSSKPFGSLDLPESELEEVRRRYFFEPMPAVRRVVFISTPHRGSRLATSLVRWMAVRVIRLPSDVVRSSARLISLRDPLGLRPGHERRVPSSLDDMSPGNPWLLALAEIPVAPSVSAHSIVAVRGRADASRGGDGVVDYGSAHVDWARSELVVRYRHSCQRRPEVIDEVHCLLLEHLREMVGRGGTPGRK